MGYAQTDSRWAGLEIGTSPYLMGPYGCLTTAHAQALFFAGYPNDDPGQVVRSLSGSGSYTGPKYVYGSGLLEWTMVSKAYPQYTWRGFNKSGRFQFVQVYINRNPNKQHWLLLYQGTYYDPYDGSTGMKSNYWPTGVVSSADISTPPAQIVQVSIQTPDHQSSVSYDPFLTDLIPSQTHSEEVARMQHFLVDRQYLAYHDVAPYWGFYGTNTQNAVHKFQEKNGISGASKYGWWYGKTRSAANNQLTISNQA